MRERAFKPQLKETLEVSGENGQLGWLAQEHAQHPKQDRSPPELLRESQETFPRGWVRVGREAPHVHERRDRPATAKYFNLRSVFPPERFASHLRV